MQQLLTDTLAAITILATLQYHIFALFVVLCVSSILATKKQGKQFLAVQLVHLSVVCVLFVDIVTLVEVAPDKADNLLQGGIVYLVFVLLVNYGWQQISPIIVKNK